MWRTGSTAQISFTAKRKHKRQRKRRCERFSLAAFGTNLVRGFSSGLTAIPKLLLPNNTHALGLPQDRRVSDTPRCGSWEAFHPHSSRYRLRGLRGTSKPTANFLQFSIGLGNAIRSAATPPEVRRSLHRF